MAEPRAQALRFEDAGAVPNNPRLPLLWWQGVLPADAGPEAFETRFARNGWGRSWRNGIFDYPHFHTNNHEVLGIVRGRVRVRLGGCTGSEVELTAGDVVVIPAGVGHQNLGASVDLLVVGAYPPGEPVDLVQDARGDEAARRRIAAVQVPASDPVDGPGGELLRHWQAPA